MEGKMFGDLREMKTRKICFYDPDKAEEFGLKTAVVHAYLWEKWNFCYDKDSITISCQEILDKMPYLSKQDVQQALSMLHANKVIKLGGQCFVKTPVKYSVTNW